jgi:hypothetical protein
MKAGVKRSAEPIEEEPPMKRAKLESTQASIIEEARWSSS